METPRILDWRIKPVCYEKENGKLKTEVVRWSYELVLKRKGGLFRPDQSYDNDDGLGLGNRTADRSVCTQVNDAWTRVHTDREAGWWTNRSPVRWSDFVTNSEVYETAFVMKTEEEKGRI